MVFLETVRAVPAVAAWVAKTTAATIDGDDGNDDADGGAPASGVGHDDDDGAAARATAVWQETGTAGKRTTKRRCHTVMLSYCHPGKLLSHMRKKISNRSYLFCC